MTPWQDYALNEYFNDPELGRLFYLAHKNLNITVLDIQVTLDFLKDHNSNREEYAAIFLLIFSYLNEGSICVNTKSPEFTSKLLKLNPSFSFDFSDQSFWKPIISFEDDLIRPLVFIDGFIYLFKKFILEKQLKQSFKSLLERDSSSSDLGLLSKTLSEVESRLTFPLHDHQHLGVIAAILNDFTIITGGPGTGKTSVLSAFLQVYFQLFLEASDKTFLVAPTGKAAQRMKDSINESLEDISCPKAIESQILNLEPSTIHKLLQTYRSDIKVHIHAELIVVDEVSMVDAKLMVELIEALPNTCKVIFLGDPHQLPSVEAGRVLADLLPEEGTSFSEHFVDKIKLVSSRANQIQNTETPNLLTDKVVKLTKSFRSEQKILELANYVNQKKTEAILKLAQDPKAQLIDDHSLTEGLPLFDFNEKESDFRSNWFDGTQSVYFNMTDALDLEVINEWFKQTLSSNTYFDLLSRLKKEFCEEALKELFFIFEQSKILTFMKISETGANAVNQFGADFVKKNTQDYDHHKVFHGCPIMVTKNDYTRALNNGDIGIVLFIDNSYKAYFPINNSFVSYQVDLLQNYELAFAMTVHKSQGSEYKNVMILLPEDLENRLLSKEILYTGITRAKECCILVGNQSVLEKAVTTQIKRESRLSLWQ
ncbi:MAG: exodeoxyribonuclease V subunit alpha [Lentisphaeraceae bacterium]|nr:exodeoxyribonuclease V subunit alpha [Lentisphaeraceae bacterium]